MVKNDKTLIGITYKKDPNFYYGWIIVGVALISMAFWLGIRSSFSVFYVALLDDFHWSRGNSAGVQSMALVTYTVLAPLAGFLIDRYGPRRVIIPGIVALSLGLSLSATIDNLTQFYLIYGVLMGAGITSIGIVSYSAIIAHWFERKRGLASGIAVSGMGIGTFVLVPLSQELIFRLGWRSAFIVLGLLVIIILVPINTVFIRHKPQDLGLEPDGIEKNGLFENKIGESALTEIYQIDWTLSRAICTGRFWAMFCFPFFSTIGIYLILIHNVRFLVDQGIPRMKAALIFAMIGVVSSVFRILWGWLSDRIGREVSFSIGMVCGSLGLFSLILLDKSGSRMFIYPFLVLFGAGWGAAAPMFMAVAADLFKGRGFGLIYGIVEGGVGIGGAFGAWVGGFIFDNTGSYQYAFLLCITVMLLSISIIWLAAPRKVHPRNIQKRPR